MKTLLRLGPANIVRVAGYRALLKSGHYKNRLQIRPTIQGPFFEWPKQTARACPADVSSKGVWENDADCVLNGRLPLFSSGWVNSGFPPVWSRNEITQVELDAANRHWTEYPDFGLQGGDVKGFWEVARFDGLLILTLGWLVSRRADFQLAIEGWLASWCQNNPTHSGVQWKCGQEAGLRVMQTLLVADLLQRSGSVNPTEAFCELVSQHCERIAPTMLYAISQENNHGTSEAAALFIGGSFLLRQQLPRFHSQAKRWQRTGRKWLEDRMQRLVLPDGSFSQHSVNYHRLMLDTYSLVETVRRQWGLARFTDAFYERCRAATHWLAALTDQNSGDAPNLGANDGARMFVLHRCPYRDFRPSVQWATVLFHGRRQYPQGPYDELLSWLDLTVPEYTPVVSDTESLCFSDGGYVKLQGPKAWALLRLPRYRFRPSHSDALHLDLWVEGNNILRDGGSFSYNTDAEWLSYFGGVVSHNTVQFDGRDQMPRISRFLFSDWLECSELHFNAVERKVIAAYRDRWGAWHRRTVSMPADNVCEVTDEISGFKSSGILRWRLSPLESEWRVDDGLCQSGRFKVLVRSSGGWRRQELVTGWESRLYAQKTPLTVFETEVTSAATLSTTITW